MLGTDVPLVGDERHPQPVGLRGRPRRRPTSRWRYPSFRADLAREIDLIEEVARVYGLDRIPSTLPPRRVGRGGLDRAQSARRLVEDLLTGAGLTQVINYSFGDDKWPGLLRLAEADARRRMVVVTNPLSLDQAFMRTMLLPGLLETARRNVSVREERVHVFEVGRVFLPGGRPAAR